MTAILRRYRLALIVLAIDLLLAVLRTPLAYASLRNTVSFLGNVLAVVPAVMILVALIDVWIPRKVVESHLGTSAGPRGPLLAIVLGTAAAGPLYAAFPIGRSLAQKGARMANIAIFLGAWGSIKIPMVLLESTYVGLRFALIRLGLTLPGVVLIGFLTEWCVQRTRSRP